MVSFHPAALTAGARFRGLWIDTRFPNQAEIVLLAPDNHSARPDEIKVSGGSLGTHPVIRTLSEKWSQDRFEPTTNDYEELADTLEGILAKPLNDPEGGIQTPDFAPNTFGAQLVKDWDSGIRQQSLELLKGNNAFRDRDALAAFFTPGQTPSWLSFKSPKKA
jgi:hypothetical protein